MIAEFSHIKAVLNLEKNIGDYPALKEIGDSVDAAIENFLGRSLEYSIYTESEVVGAVPKKRILLRALPVKEIIEIQINGEVYEGSYQITNSGLILNVVPYDSLVIKYSGGFQNIPSEIIRAANIQTMHDFQIKDHFGSETVSSSGGSVTRPPIGLLTEVRRMLNRFKHPLKWI